MKNLTNLFKLVELTRSQVQYGYVLSGVRKHELSNLAEHHYLVTFMAWQMAEYLNSKGAKLDTKKVLELCMVHDLGELFGGDISRPYAMANPEARKLAKAYELENQRFLKKYLSNLSEEVWSDVMEPKSDEALVYKLADLMECAHFLKYMGHYKPLDTKILEEKLPEVIEKFHDKTIKTELTEFYKHWISEIQSKSATEMLFD
jgi:putative hydrolases of HD superfamily